MKTATAVRLPRNYPELDVISESSTQQRSLESPKGILWGLGMGGFLWTVILISLMVFSN